MSQIQQILNYVKSISEMLNAWRANAKKVEELPTMETLNTEALIMVSDSGASKKIEIQQIIEAVSLDGQNNTVREILLGEITDNHDLNYLFDNNGITVTENELVFLSVLQTVNGTKLQRQFIWKLGKGEFNPIGSNDLETKVLELQSKFIDQVLSDELTNAPDAIVYDLGVIVDSVLEILNSITPSLNYTDDEKIYYIRATVDGVNLLYNFIGINGIYGDGESQMTIDDLVLVYSSYNSNTPFIANSFIKKTEYDNVILTGSGTINNLVLEDEKSTIVFNGSIEQINSVSYKVYPYNGKRLTLYNAQSIPVIVKDSTSGGIHFHFPNNEDFILKPGETIEFSCDLMSYPYAHHRYIGVINTSSDVDFELDDSLFYYEDDGQKYLASNISNFTSSFTWLTGDSAIFTLPFTPTNLVSIFVNGLKLYKSTQFTIILPNQIEILQTLYNEDVVEFNYEHFNNI